MCEPKIQGGYILLSRKIIESEIWSKPPLYLKVWIYLLSIAQHSDFKRLKRGQLRTSIPEIMEHCSWYVGYRKVTPTKDQIFQVLEWLRKPCGTSHEGDTKATMIATTKATQGILINIENYGYYQNSKNYESNDEGNNEKVTGATSKQRQPDNINKNDKNDKNDKNEIVYIPPNKNLKISFADVVTMKQEEYDKLANQYGESATKQMIDKLNNYKLANGKRYKDDYRAILNWVADEIMKHYKGSGDNGTSAGNSKQDNAKYKIKGDRTMPKLQGDTTEFGEL